VEHLKNNIAKILHGTTAEKAAFVGTFFYLADTPNFMREKGLRGDCFSVRYGLISHKKGKDTDHNLSENDWISLCDAITHPFAIAKNDDGFNLYTTIQRGGKWVMVGVLVKPQKNDCSINAVRTVFFVDSYKDDNYIYKSEKLTHEQEALLEGTNPHSLPPVQELLTVSH
jgi:hypothetical protein